MYPRFRKISTFGALLIGMSLFASQSYASMQMAQSPGFGGRVLIESDPKFLNVAQSKWGNNALEERCFEVAEKAEEAAKKAEKAAEEAKKAAEELRESAEEARKSGDSEAVKRTEAMAKRGEKAVENAKKAAEKARKVAEEAWHAECLDAFKRAEVAAEMAEDAAEGVKEAMEIYAPDLFLGSAEIVPLPQYPKKVRPFPLQYPDPHTSEQERYQYEGRETEVSPSQ